MGTIGTFTTAPVAEGVGRGVVFTAGPSGGWATPLQTDAATWTTGLGPELNVGESAFATDDPRRGFTQGGARARFNPLVLAAPAALAVACYKPNPDFQHVAVNDDVGNAYIAETFDGPLDYAAHRLTDAGFLLPVCTALAVWALHATDEEVVPPGRMSDHLGMAILATLAGGCGSLLFGLAGTSNNGDDVLLDPALADAVRLIIGGVGLVSAWELAKRVLPKFSRREKELELSTENVAGKILSSSAKTRLEGLNELRAAAKRRHDDADKSDDVVFGLDLNQLAVKLLVSAEPKLIAWRNKDKLLTALAALEILVENFGDKIRLKDEIAKLAARRSGIISRLTLSPREVRLAAKNLLMATRGK